MKYENAEKILPDQLVKEIQKYIRGEYLYIPMGEAKRKKWGERSGTRSLLMARNEEIYTKYRDGFSMEKLAGEYYLSIHSIKQIIYQKNHNK